MSAHHDAGGLPSHDEIHIGTRSGWRKMPAIFGVLGVAGLGLGFATMGDHSANFYFSYLVSLMFWLALGLGGLFFVIIQHGTRAGWSIVVRRLAENAMVTLPALAVLAIPVVFMGAHDLYHWTHLEVVEADPMLSSKQPYLNEGSFRMRAIVYMVVWSGLALMYWAWSTRQDNARDPIPLTHRMRWFAPLSIIFFALSLTFGAFDWLMSLDPHWFSTIFGVYYFAGCVSFIHAFLALVVILLHRSGHLRGVVTPEHFHDLGKMMFAFTVFWAYIAFSQYMLIWYANMPEETVFFEVRQNATWGPLSILLLVGHFALPFLGLISRIPKLKPAVLSFGALYLLVIHWFDMLWLAGPAARTEGSLIVLTDITMLVGLGSIFFGLLTWRLAGVSLMAVNDPRLQESLELGHA